MELRLPHKWSDLTLGELQYQPQHRWCSTSQKFSQETCVMEHQMCFGVSDKPNEQYEFES